MHLVLSTPFASPETGACSIRVDSLKASFEAKGHRVTILAPQRAGVEEIPGTIRYTGRFGLFTTLMGDSLGSFDAILGTSPPLPPNFWAWNAARLRGKPFFLDSKDPFIDQALADGSLKEGSLKHWIYSRMDSLVHRGASAIFTLTPRDKALICARHGVSGEKVEVIPNGYDPTLIFRDAALRKRIRAKEKIKMDEKAVIYAGSLGDEKIHEWINRIPKDFVEKNKLIFILVVSSDSSPAGKEHLRLLQESIGKSGFGPRFRVLHNLPYREINAYFSAADMGFVPVPHAWETCLPVKALDYAGAALPILGMGPSPSSFEDFVQESKSGFVATTWESFFAQWKKALADFSAFSKKGTNAKKQVASKFIRAVNNEKMVETIEREVGRP